MISVSDGALSDSLLSFAITVNNVNDEPVISGSPSSSVSEGGSYSFTPTVSDEDSSIFTFSITNPPSWASFNSSTGALTGTPDNGDVGTSSGIVISVSDGALSDSLASFNLTVSNVNDAPVISGSPSSTVLEGDSYSFIPTVIDVDSSSFTFSITNPPSWASFNSNTGALTGTPDNADVGTSSGIVISVSDGALSDSLLSFAITVVENASPIASDLSVELDEGESVSIMVQARDPDNLILNTIIVTQPSIGRVMLSGQSMVYQAEEDFDGLDSFTYKVNDGNSDSNIATVFVFVGSTNQAPVAKDDVFTFVANLSGIYVLDVMSNDSDADPLDVLSILAVDTVLGNVSIDNQSLQINLEDNFIGELDLGYTITDNLGGMDSATIRLSITGEGDDNAPQLTLPENVTLNATGLLTNVKLGSASAIDRLTNKALAVSLVNGQVLYRPGRHTVLWRSTNSNGRKSLASQIISLMPLITADLDLLVKEGSETEVTFYLNGPAPSYPIEVLYQVSGTATPDEDYAALSGSVTIEEGVVGHVNIRVFDDELDDEPEDIILTLTEGQNNGPNNEVVVTITDKANQARVNIDVSQSNQTRRILGKNDGLVTIRASIHHITEPVYVWNTDALLINKSTENSVFTFDPAVIPEGVYQIDIELLDNTTAEVAARDSVFLDIRTSVSVLSAQKDSDNDSITDWVEGLSDLDKDGIPDYLDAQSQCNVLKQELQTDDRFLIEGGSGACLKLGKLALLQGEYSPNIASSSQLITDDEYQYTSGLFDWVVYDLPILGQSYNVVLPQRQPIPNNAIYRKYMHAQWHDFIETPHDLLASSQGSKGVCPPPGDTTYQSGLIEGHWCVEMTIQDGGPNDQDGMLNSMIFDPGGVPVPIGNRLPIANTDNVSTRVNHAIEIDVLANDIDPDADFLNVISATSLLGDVELLVSNVLLYTPADGFIGNDEIQYVIRDSQGATASASVQVMVTANRPPHIENELVYTDDRRAVIVDVLANDTDADNDRLFILSASTDMGVVVVNRDNTLTYTPERGVLGEATVVYLVSDGEGGEAAGELVVKIPILVKSGGAVLVHSVFGWFYLLIISFRLISRMHFQKRKS